MTKSRAWIIMLGSAVFAAATIGAALYVIGPRFGFSGSRVFLSLALVAVAVLTFCGFLWQGLGHDPSRRDATLRTAITVSLVAVYLVLASFVTFFTVRGGRDELPGLTGTILTSFTVLVAIVVPFYFGSSAYVEARKSRAADEPAPSATERTES